MEKEIETRFLEVDKDEIIKKFISAGAIDKGEEKFEEMIFYPVDMSWTGKGKFVRLRKTKDKIKLTYKENIEQTVDSAREIELEVSDLEKCRQFFEKVGLKVIRQLEKYRHTFELGGVSIDIDSWPKIPAYVEIEGPTVESLKSFCNQLGFDWEKRFDGDAMQVFKHYGFDLGKISVITFSEFK